ncbi:MAG TPA: peptidoglycan bridge formation glycyltransferase FemA/FemB family protein [Candidatus Sulfomarinibacteraceae bacterium]|nr:peptidoglycan bridge formation glycyltransferase FemA/FemB family protein [Candidatus Sulfomarinibacteraceae bacterium]
MTEDETPRQRQGALQTATAASLPLDDSIIVQAQAPAQSFGPFQAITEPAVWRQALGHLGRPHPLQSWTWGDFKSRWGWSMLPLVMGDGDAPEAAALVLKRQAAGLPFSILYVPKGPLFDYANQALRDRVLDQLQGLARRERAIFIKIDPDVELSRGPQPDEETSNPVGHAWVQALKARDWRFSDDQIQFRNTVELDLSPSEDELLAAMKSKTRYNIRLAGRKGVEVRRAAPDDFPLIADLYEETADRNDFAIRPRDYYLDAWRSFHDAGMAQALIAEYEGQPLGAVIVVASGGRAIYMYGASTEAERQRMPNYLLQWEAIRWAKERGCRVYDFWGAPDEFVESDSMWGVWRFKSGFGGDVVRHIGAWDYPARRLWYWLYTVLMPRYLSFLRSRG